MQEEQNRGLAFVNALGEPRRQQAILSFAKESDNNLTEAWKDNVVRIREWVAVRSTSRLVSLIGQTRSRAGLHVRRNSTAGGIQPA
jgi:hypothetical protein